MAQGVNWVWLTSRSLSLLLKHRLALRNLEASCKPGECLGRRNTLQVETSCLLILPNSPDRNQHLETQIFFGDDSCLQWIPSPLLLSPRHKVLLPAGADRPHAPLSWTVFEVRQSCAVAGGSGELEGRSRASWNSCCSLRLQLSLSLLKKNVCSLLFHNVCCLLAIIRERGSVWFYRSPSEAVCVCRVDGDRQLPKPWVPGFGNQTYAHFMQV